jgi:hypothetical protein
MRPVRHGLSQSLAAKRPSRRLLLGRFRVRANVSCSVLRHDRQVRAKAIEESRPRGRRGGDVLFPDSVDGKQPLAREIAINATRCRCQAFAPLSSRRSTSGPPSSRSAVRRRFTCTRQFADLARCRSGSAPGNALSASGRLSLYVVSRRSPVRSSVMYQLKNSVGFGIACGARTTLPRIGARACVREGYRTSGRSHQSGCHAGTEGESAARASLAPLCRHWS